MPIDDTHTFQIPVHGSENLIRNSNGNHWEPYSENIQAAINDLGDLGQVHGTHQYDRYGGTVWLPGLCEFETANTVFVNKNVILDMGGSVIKPQGNFNAIQLDRSAEIKNGAVDLYHFSVAGQIYDKAMIYVPNVTSTMLTKHHEITNMRLIGNIPDDGSAAHAGYMGTGIHLHGQPNVHGAVFFLRANNIRTQRCECGIHIQNESPGIAPNTCSLNGNHFSDLFFNQDKRSIWLERNITAEHNPCSVAGNIFDRIQVECSKRWVSVIGPAEFAIKSDGYGNIFNNTMIWDWSAAQGNPSVWFTNDTRQGFVMGRISMGGVINNNESSSQPNTIISLGASDIRARSFTNI